MKTDVQVAVIGGGIVGVSVLYWLAKMGWTDSVLIERRELTSGSTWHAAGNTTYFGPYPAMTPLFAGSIRTYLQAEKESSHSVSFHQTGSLRLAATHTPTDGHVDPTNTTHALAKAARKLGAEIQRQCPVKSLHRNDTHWILETEKGKVTAQHVVVATSFWARELLAPLGLNLPLYATQHHEFITEAIPELKTTDLELPAWRDSYSSCNVRQEAQGVLAGVYECPALPRQVSKQSITVRCVLHQTAYQCLDRYPNTTVYG